MTTIQTPGIRRDRAPAADALRVFISSRMAELAPERATVREALASAGFAPWLYEVDAGAGPGSPRQTYLDVLYSSDVYLGIFWQTRGEYTIDEFDAARRSGIACLVYEKVSAERDHDLSAFLDEIGDVESGVTIRRFGSPEELAGLVSADVRRVQAELVRVSSSNGRTYTGNLNGGRFDVTAKATPMRRHPLQASDGPRPPQPFIDRIDSVDRLRHVIGSDESLLGVTGVPGMGKSSVLRRVADDPNASAELFPDGLGIYIEGDDWPRAGDLLRALWSKLYRVADHRFIPDDTALRAGLKATRSLVFVDGVRLRPDEVDRIHAEVPRSAFVMTADETADGEPGPLAYTKTVRLTEFAEAADILALFAARYEQAVSSELTDAVVRLCRSAGASPGMITRLANEAWGSGLSLADWVGQKQAGSNEPNAGSSDEDQRTLGILAAFGPDLATPGEVTSRLGVGPDQLSTLIVSGRVIAVDPDHRLPGAEYLTVSSGSDLEGLRAEIFDATVQWIGDATPARLEESRTFILRVLDWGEETDRHRGVVLLARAVAPQLAVVGAWDSWGAVTDKALGSARAMSSKGEEAWALHEAGTRQLMLGNKGEARQRLRAARRLRRRDGDVAGAAISTHNLRYTGGFAPTWRRWAVVAGAVLVIGALAQMIQAGPELDFGEVVSGNVSLQYQEFSNDGDIATTHTVEIDGDPAFCLMSPEGPICPAPALPTVETAPVSTGREVPECQFEQVVPADGAAEIRVEPQSECVVGVRFAPVLDPGETRREALGELRISTDEGDEVVELIGVGIRPSEVTTTMTTLVTTTTTGTSSSTSDPDPTSTAPATTVTIPANLPPVATNDEALVDQGGQALIPVLRNDDDPDGDPETLRIVVATDPSHGDVEVGDDFILYRHDGVSAEPDSFEYTVEDVNGGTDSATVSTQIIPVNAAPIANADTQQVFCRQSNPITLTGSDADGDMLEFGIFRGPRFGTLGDITPSSDTQATVDYTAADDSGSNDSFVFRVDDGREQSSATITLEGSCVD